ncbi:Rho GTPase-activating protein 19 [Amphibalanus amphitrite]|uniref:Rho GTPase-activating protein 19 n=1 Tax=Amphibalanus amphitrite TaxID=1232801 RepID=A0A6A4WUD3_AMPAM|nr:Rho GTPase-activating protein 19 [Amphibalanus amphitrite]
MDEDVSFSTSFSSVDAETVMMNMRHQDETQFFTLVKMHLSFLLHFTVDEVDAPVNSEDKNNESSRKILPFSTKSKSKSSRNGEGVVLSHEGVCQAYQLIEFLSRDDNLTHEGLFRKTGNIARQQELRQDLMSGASIDFESGVYSAHDCASVLKGFLASLSEPLLTKALYPAHCQVADICPVDTPADQICAAHNKQIKALQLLFLLVPAENYQLLKDLLFLLYKVSRKHSENKMNALNLGTMFAPHILCPRKMSAAELQNSSGSMAQAVALMIENTPLLFKVPHELEVDMRAFLARHDGTPGLNRQRRRRHSCSDASVDSPQASTVFTFVDRQQSAAAGERDDTETALAGLYAHISSMPDSARRRKLIKQFNRESGAGTPNLAQRTRTRSFGESLRKHLFFAGKARKGAAASGKAALSRRSASEEALASPPSPESRRRFREAPDADDSVSMWPTPSLGGGGPALKRALLTPTAAAGRFTPRLARSLRQVQRESVPAHPGGVRPLPGSARRPDRTAEMSTFRAGRNNSMRRGQVPLRPVRVDAVQPPPGPSSPISQKMDTMCSTTRVQMLTPRNRRAVCLLSHSRLPAATQAAPPSPVQMAPLSPVQMASLDDSPSAAKRARGADVESSAALSSPFQHYLLQRDMLTAEPVDLSLLEVASPPPAGAASTIGAATDSTITEPVTDSTVTDAVTVSVTDVDSEMTAAADTTGDSEVTPARQLSSCVLSGPVLLATLLVAAPAAGSPLGCRDQIGSGRRLSFLCVTLSSDQLETVARQLLFNEPHLYASQLAPALEARYPLMARVVAGKRRSRPPWFSVRLLTTAAGLSLATFAKARQFGKDLYADLVAPATRVDLLTETWMNGPRTNLMKSECSLAYHVQNVRDISVTAERAAPTVGRLTITFKSSEDHSKWAVSEDAARPWVCVGDINRMLTQEERGGGTVCRWDAVLWRLYSQLVADVEPYTLAAAHSADDGYRSLTSTSSGASLPHLSPVQPSRAQRRSLADLSNRRTDPPAAAQTGLLSVSECWTDASLALPTEPPSDDGENQRRKTLTDRETNPMAHRKIGAARKRRSVLFETDL